MYDTCNRNQSTCINSIQVAVEPSEFSALTWMCRKRWYRRPDGDETGRSLGQISSSMTGQLKIFSQSHEQVIKGITYKTAGAGAWVL